MVPTRTVSDDVRKVLARCTVEHDAIIVPNDADGKRLDRRLYVAVNSVLESLGGTWNRKRQAHVFTETMGDELADAFYAVVETGTWERAQDAGYYPTPDWLVDRMIATAAIEGFHRVLEPSAGQGAILTKLAQKLQSRHQLAVCELLSANQLALTKLGFMVDASDFLDFTTDPIFDRVVMNPPFAKSGAARHVQHAMSLLKPGGRLVAIMPNSIMQRQDTLHRAVRQQIVLNGTITPLPDDAFRESGTLVRTVMVTYDRPGDDGANGRGSLKQPAPPTAQRATVATQEPPTASEASKTTDAPSPRFRRLSTPSGRFRRLSRKTE
jgi:phospholipid N-methyltransferase